MLNLLVNLKNTNNSVKNSTSIWIVFSAFCAGAVLFWLCGKELISAIPVELSERNFFFAFTSVFCVLFLAAFSQLGMLLAAAADAAFEFLTVCFAFSHLAVRADARTVLYLCLQIFLITVLSMLFSQKAIYVSSRLFAKSIADKKSAAEFIGNFVLFLAAFLILLIICLYAF